MSEGEDLDVRRTDLQTDLYRYITLSQAMDELEQAGKHRGHAMVALCDGDAIKTATHSYRMLT